MTLQEKVLEIATKEIGKCEHPKGSNWGADVKKYLQSVGISFPAPWCMSFVYWCVNEACKELEVSNPLFKTGGVLVQYQRSKTKYGIKSNPEPGDIFIMQFSALTGHTGFVESVTEDHIETIEGNSNDEGSREGYEVCRKPGGRKKTSIYAYLRLPE